MLDRALACISAAGAGAMIYNLATGATTGQGWAAVAGGLVITAFGLMLRGIWAEMQLSTQITINSPKVVEVERSASERKG